MSVIERIGTPGRRRKAMKVVLALPCFSRNRCEQNGRTYCRKEKHKGRRDW